MKKTMGAPLKVLMLQGPPTRFWWELGAGLRDAGHRVSKVHFCLGDRLYWRGGGDMTYRGPVRAWPDWLEAYCQTNGITDILYFADRLPYHRLAARVAARVGARAWAIENGYLRPFWLTLEPFGMGRHSRFPKSPERIRHLAEGLEEPGPPPDYNHAFAREAAPDVGFHLANLAGRPVYRHYASDRYYSPIVEYLSWVPRVARQMAARRRFAEIEQNCASGVWRYTLLAMQLQMDYQIRHSSDYTHLSEMLEEVIASFALNAPADRHLVIKSHPADNGTENWGRQIAQIAAARRVSDRVHWIDGGDLDTLLDNAVGLVTVNSTVGMFALRRGIPTIALGTAVYDIPGLTHQAGLVQFWNESEPVDPSLASALVSVLAHRLQVRGSFHNPQGRARGIEEIVSRLQQPHQYWTG